MAETSIFYRHPRLYKSGLRLIHGWGFKERYKYIAGLTKRGDVVLEPGCGPVVMARFLPRGVKYMGFDMNEAFVKYARRKGWNVWWGNVLDNLAYKKADVIAVCDVYHHLKRSERRQFIKLCWGGVRRALVICEPGATSDGIWERVKRRIAAWGDRDGTNAVSADHYMTDVELLELARRGFGVIPAKTRRTIKTFGGDIVTVFFKRP